jgi:hypothetical protein
LIATPNSLPARSAPALTDFQKTWVVPLGTTPIVTPPDEDPLLSHAIVESSSVAQHVRESSGRANMVVPPFELDQTI